MNDPKLKQKIAEKIKDSANILVTVSNDPSVDELSAALGLTLLLNKLDKHTTAVFSGKTPPAITFLDPEKTFEDTTDSLRDFIIALDKEKADHLRYKLEGDLVKIYITPYRSIITDEDLEFSQGDYNVELVIALGVENKGHLDAALAGHGQILDDATIVTLTSGQQTSDLGSIDWNDANASSLSEMVMSLFETMRVDKKLLDRAVATAWMTGIVAATERFSNSRTTSRAMTLSATLMSAGADQQLIASKLKEGQEVAPDPQTLSEIKPDDAFAEGKRTKISKQPKKPAEKKPDDGSLMINHTYDGSLDDVAREVDKNQQAASTKAAEEALKEQMAKAEQEPQAEAAPAKHKPATPSKPKPSQATPDSEPPTPQPIGAVEYVPPAESAVSEVKSGASSGLAEPTFGGTLNATSDQEQEAKRREERAAENKVILSHSSHLGDSQPEYQSPINGALDAHESEKPLAALDSSEEKSDDFIETPSRLDKKPTPLDGPSTPKTPPAPPAAPPAPLVAPTAPVAPPAPVKPPAPAAAEPTLSDLDALHRQPQEDSLQGDEAARADVAAALAGQAPDLAGGLPLPPPPPPPPISGDASSGLPPLPPIPDQEPERIGDILAQDLVQAQPSAATPANDPGQFRIPGQQ